MSRPGTAHEVRQERETRGNGAAARSSLPIRSARSRRPARERANAVSGDGVRFHGLDDRLAAPGERTIQEPAESGAGLGLAGTIAACDPPPLQDVDCRHDDRQQHPAATGMVTMRDAARSPPAASTPAITAGVRRAASVQETAYSQAGWRSARHPSSRSVTRLPPYRSAISIAQAWRRRHAARSSSSGAL